MGKEKDNKQDPNENKKQSKMLILKQSSQNNVLC